MKFAILGILAALLFIPEAAFAQDAPVCAPGSTCVSADDLKAMVAILKEKQCLLKTKPSFELDPVNLVIDKEGRIFFSGAAPQPYSLRMTWCNYEATATGKVNVVAAVQEPPDWGFHFRPKAYMGVLPLEPFHSGNNARSMVDAGLMLDPFYYKFVNLDMHVGFRAVGAGIGLDIFRSFGAYAGYAVTWDGFRSNPEAALWFSFW